MVFGLSRHRAPEPNNTALSDVANTHRAKVAAAAVAPTEPNLSALHQAPPSTNQEPVYTGDPENQIIVFDMDETTIDTGDKKKLDVEATTRLGRTIELIAKNSTDNSFGDDIRYVLRPGVKELFEYLHSKGHKIVLTTRNYQDYADTIVKHDQVLKQYVSGVLARPDFEESAINKDFTKYPNHPDNLSLWQKFKSILAKVFIKTPKFIWGKFAGIFTGRQARWDPGKGKLGKYPPNMLELLAVKGNHKLDGLKAPHFLIDNQATYATGSPQDYRTYRYYGREFDDSIHSGDFAVVSPNVVRDNGHQATSFHADLDEPRVDGGEYLWVKNVKKAVERGWRAQFKVVTGKEPKV